MKVPRNPLRACAEAGMGKSEAARHLGVSRGAVEYAATQLGITFVDKRSQVASERMRKLRKDPKFLVKLNPMARLTPDQRAEYDALKKAGYSRAEAFKEIGVKK